MPRAFSKIPSWTTASRWSSNSNTGWFLFLLVYPVTCLTRLSYRLTDCEIDCLISFSFSQVSKEDGKGKAKHDSRYNYGAIETGKGKVRRNLLRVFRRCVEMCAFLAKTWTTDVALRGLSKWPTVFGDGPQTFLILSFSYYKPKFFILRLHLLLTSSLSPFYT